MHSPSHPVLGAPKRICIRVFGASIRGVFRWCGRGANRRGCSLLRESRCCVEEPAKPSLIKSVFPLYPATVPGALQVVGARYTPTSSRCYVDVDVKDTSRVGGNRLHALQKRRGITAAKNSTGDHILLRSSCCFPMRRFAPATACLLVLGC